MKYDRSIIYHFCLALAIILTILLTLGIYYQSSEKLMAAMFYGQISNPPTTLWLMENWMFQLPIISFLSTKFNTVSIFGYWHISLITIATALWIHLLYQVFYPIIYNIVLRTILVILLAIGIAGTSMVHVYYVRDAILIASSSMFLYFFYYSTKERVHFLFLIPFLYACTIRVSVVLLVVGLISITLLVHTRQLRKTFVLLKYFWAVSASIFLIAECYRAITSNPAMKIEARIEYAIYDRGALKHKTEMKTKSDSIRYVALSNYCLIMDSSKISLQYVKKFIDPKKYGNYWISKDDIAHFINNSFPLILENKTYILLFYLMLLSILYKKPKHTAYTIILFNLTAWFIVFLIGCKLRVYPYFFEPWLSVIVGGSLYFSMVGIKSISSINKTLLIFISVVLAYIQITKMEKTANEEKLYNITAYSYLNKIKNLAHHQTPLLWTSDESYLPSDLFARGDTEPLKYCLYMNWSYFFYFEWTRERFMQRLGFNPLDWKQMSKSIVNQKSKICIITSPEFASFLAEYLNVLYSANISFVQAQPRNEIVVQNFVYQIKAKVNE